MKIQYCSDLHLEFGYNKTFLQAHPIKPTGDILLLAGDIVPFYLIERNTWFFDFVANNFGVTYWIPGNHEYYHSSIDNDSLMLNKKIRDNVFLINNHSVRHENVKLIFSTLWSSISPANEWEIQQSIRDFEAIKYGKGHLTPFHFNQIHETCKAFISEEIEQNDAEKTIAVTHHVPTFMNYPAKYKGSPYNEAFGVELYDLIEKSNVDYWLYGHHHQSVPDFEIGKTKLITNQLGYVEYREHFNFQPDRMVV